MTTRLCSPAQDLSPYSIYRLRYLFHCLFESGVYIVLSSMQPNKVYIGGLPEHTRKEDLESCFGKIGNIVNIELK